MTEPLTILHEQTLEDVRPPCETSSCEPVDAVWIAKFRCGACGHQPWQLLCDPHFQRLLARWPARCTDCDLRGTTDYELVSFEELR